MVNAPHLVRLEPSARGKAGPFLKWAGGKRQLVPSLMELAPATIDTYYEPFVGGGALFFALQAAGRFRRAVLADQNRELIDCYKALKKDVERVIGELEKLSPDEKDYYRIRAADPSAMSAPQQAARLIYLNKIGFNGLYRVNSKGQFNVPFGRHLRPTVCDHARLRAVSRALAKNVTLICRDFEKTVAAAVPGDFVYFDPPYVPISATAYFTAYARTPFGPKQQERLAATLRKLGEQRVAALLSNSECAETKRLYADLCCERVEVRRAINSVASRRGPVGELLVKSFDF